MMFITLLFTKLFCAHVQPSNPCDHIKISIGLRNAALPYTLGHAESAIYYNISSYIKNYNYGVYIKYSYQYNKYTTSCLWNRENIQNFLNSNPSHIYHMGIFNTLLFVSVEADNYLPFKQLLNLLENCAIKMTDIRTGNYMSEMLFLRRCASFNSFFYLTDTEKLMIFNIFVCHFENIPYQPFTNNEITYFLQILHPINVIRRTAGYDFTNEMLRIIANIYIDELKNGVSGRITTLYKYLQNTGFYNK